MRRGPRRLASVSASLDGDIGPRRLNISHTTLDHRTTLADTRATTVQTIMEANRVRPGFDEVLGVAFPKQPQLQPQQWYRGRSSSSLDLASQAELSQRARSQLTQSGLGVLGARLVGQDGDVNPARGSGRLQDHLAACSLKPLSR